jgi:methyl-accepting chemotaxis protein
MAQMVDTARMAQVHFKKQVQEWKDILLRGNDNDLFHRHLYAFENEERLVIDNLDALKKMTANMTIAAPQIDDSIEIHKQLGQKYREALKAYKQSDLRSAVVVDKTVRGIDREPTDRIDQLLYTIREQAERRLKETEMSATTTLQSYQTFSIFLIFLILLTVGFGIFMTFSILNDLDKEKNGDHIKDDD